MLHKLKSPKQNTKKKRVGRGVGSKKGGHTTGRGQKGQKSRSGYSQPRPFWEGGSMPLPRRIPKLRGFSRRGLTHKLYDVRISLDDLNNLKAGTTVTNDNLYELGLVEKKSKRLNPKILAKGKIDKKINIKGVSLSATAKEKIEKAGGKVS